jgi:hypothetical protein
MYRRATLTPTSLVLCLAVGLLARSADAQEKQHVSFKMPAENSKYTQQVNIEVEDAPHHIVRIFEIHRTFPNNAPLINGLKLVEVWDRGTADYIDGNGTNLIYSTGVMENGDKFFSRGAVIVQNSATKLSATAILYITGGTGKLAQIQGIIRTVANLDPKAGYNEAESTMDYSIGK